MDAGKLQEILDNHKKWLKGEGGTRANLREANLTRANLTGANLTGANLTEAVLTGANLTEAVLDFAAWPLWCGSKGVKVDARIAAQLAAHFCVLDCDDAAYQAARAAILDFAKSSHRAQELGLK
jgi:hypothetical protein